MNARIATATVLLLAVAGMAQAQPMANFQLTSLSVEAGVLHGAVCRASVTTRPLTPAVQLQTIDAAGKVVAERSVALYGARRQRAGGCAYFNTVATAAAGQALKVCISAAGRAPDQCVAAPQG